MTRNKKNNYAIIVSGGLGTRLWPLSHAKYPKQFIPLFDGQSLFQRMIKSARATVALENILIVCPADFAAFIRRQAPGLPKANIIIEPERKDNFAAIVLAVAAVYARNREAKIALLWSDHYIFDHRSFVAGLLSAFSFLVKYPESLVVVGTKPDYPETGFGYIKKGRLLASAQSFTRGTFLADGFKEKPDLKTAERYCLSDKYLWNTGYKIVSAQVFLRQIEGLYPDLKKTLNGLDDYFTGKRRSSGLSGLKKLYQSLPTGSIEFLYTNKLKKVVVIESRLKWSDVGNWDALGALLGSDPKSFQGQPVGASLLVDSNNVSVYGNHKLVATVGMKDVIVVESKLGFLIVHKSAVHKVKDLYAQIQQKYPRLA